MLTKAPLLSSSLLYPGAVVIYALLSWVPLSVPGRALNLNNTRMEVPGLLEETSPWRGGRPGRVSDA